MRKEERRTKSCGPRKETCFGIAKPSANEWGEYPHISSFIAVASFPSDYAAVQAAIEDIEGSGQENVDLEAGTMSVQLDCGFLHKFTSSG